VCARVRIVRVLAIGRLVTNFIARSSLVSTFPRILVPTGCERGQVTVWLNVGRTSYVLVRFFFVFLYRCVMCVFVRVWISGVCTQVHRIHEVLAPAKERERRERAREREKEREIERKRKIERGET
jgi:hypothetical protein